MDGNNAVYKEATNLPRKFNNHCLGMYNKKIIVNIVVMIDNA